jgi:cytochrome b
MNEPTARVRVWDAPTRLFHWALVLLVGFSWLSARQFWMEWHVLSGYAVLALLLFRIVWGLIGSETARFSHFLAGPLAVLRHLSHLHRREPDRAIGHNPAGGWMVLLLLVLLCVEAVTGLYANDQVLTEGPLAATVSEATGYWLNHIHVVNFKLIELAVLLHVAAVAAYAVLKGHNLVRPMVTGWKRLPADLRPPRLANPLLALVLAAIAASAVAWLVNSS